ncbi:helix-turn-helix transcriptional regulator [Isoptericola nanjingensis]|uniref:helix-turn-helix transcriptional regulator n=1 Tax=Isoptericola TaxID=254250 RepID=UPI0035E8D680|nr:helix-turn-helix domain-containing protein [Isoptericola sp. QY 916]
MTDADRTADRIDRDLGALLRAYREDVRPRDVGMPEVGRRRTPGLRRAELAVLAGVSVEYLTRLEQGRDRHPSPAVVGALADALRLGHDERRVLLLASKDAQGAGVCLATAPGDDIPAGTRAVLDRLAPAPAALLDRFGTVLACTPAYRALLAPAGLFDHGEPRLAPVVLTDPRARDLFPDWDAVADRVVADLQRESVPSDPVLGELVDALTVLAGAAFTERWARPVADRGRDAVLRLAHPQAGALRVEPQVLVPGGGEHLRIELLLPADEATERALDDLAAGDRTLRVVRSDAS